MISLIVAVDNQGGFGKDGKIPWYFPEDFRYFKETTKGKVCVMGGNTYIDMVNIANERNRDITSGILPDRKSYVISSTLPDDSIGVTVVRNLDCVIKLHPDEEIMILGGERLYNQAISQADTVYLTCIDHCYDCDNFFPVEELVDNFTITDGNKITADEGKVLMFITYSRTKP